MSALCEGRITCIIRWVRQRILATSTWGEMMPLKVWFHGDRWTLSATIRPTGIPSFKRWPYLRQLLWYVCTTIRVTEQKRKAQIQLLVTSPRQLARMVRRPKGAPGTAFQFSWTSGRFRGVHDKCLMSGGERRYTVRWKRAV